MTARPSLNTQTPTVESPTLTLAPASPQVRRAGYLSFPFRHADAGLFSLQPGETIRIIWEEAPLGAEIYEILYTPFEGRRIFIGVDEDDFDGVHVSWIVPEGLAGRFEGIARFEDGTEILAGASGQIYSGRLPPAGVCSLSSSSIGVVDLYRDPQFEAETFAYLIPGEYAEAYQRTADGWYLVDAGPAIDFISGEAAVGTGWISRDQNVEFFGPCDNLPIAQ